ncbi:quaternary amine ABC transporter ATP-binding protein [Candidatus Enterovibrio altilux]|uniref:Quaternary amine transport ATP-binding protein n=1 Tax=Candidatus Enterovibrio altilux TaxID=1927128 RepID=A0A291BAS5_9GAMM|nr:glycine betaine/L-proline ABC transporter ATP-binding protein [Candidatus Enterovibrio luxaltus]ATF10119.1 L-proline glycine betaine ABC transport system permease protein ProV [Candidatus Enterovibrio luxaltus]
MSSIDNTDPLIKVKDLYKIFGNTPRKILPFVKKGKSKANILATTGHTVGLQQINLNVQRSEIFVIMGLSGSGKSTLIRHFNRLIEPTEGQIIVEGEDIMKFNAKGLQHFRRYKMSMVFQRFGLMPHRTVLQNVAYGLHIQGVAKTDRNKKAIDWLETVGLSGYENQYPSQLSGGQQQRIGLARALCTDAEILLMDEAFSALDPLIRSEMQNQLIDLQEKLQKTIIFITHDLDEALQLGDRIAILRDGKLVQQGRPVDILMSPANYYVEAFVKDVNRARAITVETVMKPPDCRVSVDTIGGAISQMRNAKAAHGYYINNGIYQGVLRRQHLESFDSSQYSNVIDGSILETVPSIQANVLLEAVISDTLKHELPLPVLDEDGKIQGQLSRVNLAEVLSNQSNSSSANANNILYSMSCF